MRVLLGAGTGETDVHYKPLQTSTNVKHPASGLIRVYFGMEEFYSYKKKTTKKTKQGNKIQHNKKKEKENIYTIAKQINSSGTAYLLMYLVINAA